MSEWFIIQDLSDFTDKVRAIVYNNFGDWRNESSKNIIESVKEEERSDFDRVLSYQESLTIVKDLVKKQTNKKTKKVRYILNDKTFAKIIENLNSRMVSNVLNTLVQKGLVESAFDEKSNDFIFWVKEEKNENKKDSEKPETD
jgi:predicted transcriptional regulator